MKFSKTMMAVMGALALTVAGCKYDDAADADADEPSDDNGEEVNTDETDVVDDSSSDDSETVNE